MLAFMVRVLANYKISINKTKPWTFFILLCFIFEHKPQMYGKRSI